MLRVGKIYFQICLDKKTCYAHKFIFYHGVYKKKIIVNCYDRILWLTTFANSQGSRGASIGKEKAIFAISYNKLLNICGMFEATIIAMTEHFFLSICNELVW